MIFKKRISKRRRWGVGRRRLGSNTLKPYSSRYNMACFRQFTVLTTLTSNIAGVTANSLDLGPALLANADFTSMTGCYKKCLVTFAKTKISSINAPVVTGGTTFTPFGIAYIAQSPATPSSLQTICDAKDHLIMGPADTNSRYLSYKPVAILGVGEPYATTSLGSSGYLGSLLMYQGLGPTNSQNWFLETTFNVYFTDPA